MPGDTAEVTYISSVVEETVHDADSTLQRHHTANTMAFLLFIKCFILLQSSFIITENGVIWIHLVAVATASISTKRTRV